MRDPAAACAQVLKFSLVPPRGGFGKPCPSLQELLIFFKAECKETPKQLMSGVSDSSPCSCSGLAGSS